MGVAVGVGVPVAVGVGVGVGVAVGVGVEAGMNGIVVRVICATKWSGVGESAEVCARDAGTRDEETKAPTRNASISAAAPRRDGRKACFTKNPPNGCI